jgi:hypothetical protein
MFLSAPTPPGGTFRKETAPKLPLCPFGSQKNPAPALAKWENMPLRAEKIPKKTQRDSLFG